MNYRKLAMKDRHFEGLSEQQAKKLFVYFTHIAKPTMTPTEIFRRYGFCLPNSGMNMGESVLLAIEVMQELTSDY